VSLTVNTLHVDFIKIMRESVRVKVSPKLMKVLCKELGLSITERDIYIEKAAERVKTIGRLKEKGEKSVYCIIVNVITEMKRVGATNVRVNHHRLWAFAPILFWFAVHGKEKYDTLLISKLSDAVNAAHRSGKFSYGSFLYFEQGISIVETYYDYGKLKITDIPHKEKRLLGTDFELLIDLYRERHGEYSCLATQTLNSRLSVIRAFLYSLEQQGIKTIGQFSHSVISEGITAFASFYGSGLSSMLGDIRKFLNFLQKVGAIGIDYSEAVPQGVPKRRKIRYGFTNDEVAAMLDTVNQDSQIGKRDYAMMLIAARTGLRAVDIANLKRLDIDWRTNEIRIVQQKTNVGLVLPLSPEVGNAIAQYLLYVRPDAETPYIFLDCYRPYDPIKPETIGSVVTKYMARIEAINPITPNRRTHAFRRGFAMNLLNAQISNDMMIEMLGQVEPNSSKAYLPIDENGLKNCAITLASVKREGA